MPKKSDTKSFIDRATVIHDGFYNYSNSIYINNTAKVEIICPMHGVFTQSPSGHLSGKGCIKCGINRVASQRRLSSEFYISKINEAHPNLRILSTPSSWSDRIDVKDENDIIYNVSVNKLIQKRVPSIITAVDKNLAFEIKAKLIHGDRYDYSKSIYKNCRTNLVVICPIHGEFDQTPSKHLSGHGCHLCGREAIIKSAKANPTGWTISDWISASEKSNTFTGFKLYVLECFNDFERFVKIGRTFNSVAIRYKCESRMPYDYKILHEYIDNAHHIFKLEAKLKRQFKKYKYLPLIEFGGMHECFSIDILNELNLDKYVNT